MNFMTPIESPNLPKRGITLAAVSVGAEKAKEYLLSRGISVFDILPCAAITDGTAAHADFAFVASRRAKNHIEPRAV